MGLGGLDRSGVVELALPDLPLSLVDEEPHAGKKDNKNDDDSLFQYGTSSGQDGSSHTTFPEKS